jgi:hypothetical protein
MGRYSLLAALIGMWVVYFYVDTMHTLNIVSSIIALNVRSCVHVRNSSSFNYLRTRAEN